MKTTNNQEPKGKVMTPKAFDALVKKFTLPVATWQHIKPAKRNAFLLFSDKDIGEWHIRLLGNKRAKYFVPTAIEGLIDAMKAHPELFAWIRAAVRFIEREQKKEAKKQTIKERDYGKGDV